MRDQHREPAAVEASQERQQIQRRRARQAGVDDQDRLVARDHDLADDARPVVLLAAPDAVGELVDHGFRASSRSPTTARAAGSGPGDVQRPRSAQAHEVGQVEGRERRERVRHRRDHRALDEQLLEAPDEGPAGRTRDPLVERGGQQRDQAEGTGAPDGDAPRVDLLTGRVALRQPLHASRGRRRPGSRAGRGPAARPPSRARTRSPRSRPCHAGRARVRPSRASARPPRPPTRARAPCRAHRVRSGRREPRRPIRTAEAAARRA